MNKDKKHSTVALVAGGVLMLGVTAWGFQQAQLSSISSALGSVQTAVNGIQTQSGDSEQSALQTDATELPRTYAAGEVLAKFKPGVPKNVQAQVLKKAGVTIKKTIDPLGIHILTVPEQAERAVQQALANNPRFEFAELNYLQKPQYIPNDPQFSDQWHHTKMDSALAWDVASSTEIIIGIADTGVDSNHPDLVDHLVPGYNVVSNNTDTEDVYGHGTKSAGVAAAVGDNANQVAGVAYDARIMPLKITERSDGWAYLSDMAEAITYAADHGSRLVNISYSGCGSYSVDNAASYMQSKNGLVVIAAGNSGGDPGYPAASEVICVSATTKSDSRPSWSSYGDHVDLSAPGTGIRTTAKGGGTGSPSGTSFSTPLTSGLVALVWGANPNLTHDQVEQIIEDTAIDLGTSGWDQYYGWGRIEADAAVAKAAATEAPEEDTTAPTTTITSPLDGDTIEGSVTITASASDDVALDRVEMYVNGNLLGSDSTDPYSFYWDTTQETNGNHNLETRAIDTSGNTATSETVTVTVDNVSTDTIAPTVSITEPQDGATLRSKGSFTITSSASDNVAVSQIDILFDNTIYETCVDLESCSVNINAKKVSSGSHSISTTATDSSGNSASDTITVTIQSGGGSDDDGGGGSGKPDKCSPWPQCK